MAGEVFPGADFLADDDEGRIIEASPGAIDRLGLIPVEVETEEGTETFYAAKPPEGGWTQEYVDRLGAE